MLVQSFCTARTRMKTLKAKRETVRLTPDSILQSVAPSSLELQTDEHMLFFQTSFRTWERKRESERASAPNKRDSQHPK